eukprot:2708797-Amphidinium_carterae.3
MRYNVPKNPVFIGVLGDCVRLSFCFGKPFLWGDACVGTFKALQSAKKQQANKGKHSQGQKLLYT